MKWLLKLEWLALFVFSVYLFSLLQYEWWWFPALLLLPDVSMVGYLINPEAGAWSYNWAHHLGVGIATYLIAVYAQSDFYQLIGIILIAHISMDRIFGFGLKYTDSFKHTHLGNLP